MLSYQERIDRAGARLVAVGFSPTEALADLADYLQWPGLFLSDPERLSYRRLGFRRASPLRVYGPGVLLGYARRALRGQRVIKPVEDTLQLGGDAVVAGGRVLQGFPTAGPDGRAPAATIIARLEQHRQ